MKWYRFNNRAHKFKWHVWYAWYPVKVATTPDGDYKLVWFEDVKRCKYFFGFCGLHGTKIYSYKYAELGVSDG